MEHLDCIIYINKTFEEAKALSVNGEVVITGDTYHDKIDHVIEGFFYGLDYVIINGAQYSYSKSEKEIGADDVMFEACEFYDDEGNGDD